MVNRDNLKHNAGTGTASKSAHICATTIGVACLWLAYTAGSIPRGAAPCVFFSRAPLLPPTRIISTLFPRLPCLPLPGTPLCPASCDPAAEAAAAVGELMKADVVLTTYQVGVLSAVCIKCLMLQRRPPPWGS